MSIFKFITTSQLRKVLSAIHQRFIGVEQHIDTALSESVSDWDESDSTNRGYIKNRTHYRTSLGYTFPLDLTNYYNSYVMEATDEANEPNIPINKIYDYFTGFSHAFWDSDWCAPHVFMKYFPNDNFSDLNMDSSDEIIAIVNGATHQLSSYYEDYNEEYDYGPYWCLYDNDVAIWMSDFGESQLSITMIYTNIANINSLILNLPIKIERLSYYPLDDNYLNGRLIKSGSGYMSEVFNYEESPYEDEFGLYLSGFAGEVQYIINDAYIDSTPSIDYAINKSLTLKRYNDNDEIIDTGIKIVNYSVYNLTDSGTCGLSLTLTDTLDANNGIEDYYVFYNVPYNPMANGEYSHAEGSYTFANGNYSHAEGYGNYAYGEESHAEGCYNSSLGIASHAEGTNNNAYGYASHVEGESNLAKGAYSHVEGISTYAYGGASHAEGGATNLRLGLYLTGAAGATTFTVNRIINGDLFSNESLPLILKTLSIMGIRITNCSGGETVTSITLESSLSNSIINDSLFYTSNVSSVAIGQSSHAEGCSQSIGNMSHAEGEYTIAYGVGSHSEGQKSHAGGMYSHAEGYGTYATVTGQHVEGQWNEIDEDGLLVHIVGNGSSSNRSNAHTLDWNGNGWYAGKLTVGAGPTNNMDVATKQYVDNAVGGGSGGGSGGTSLVTDMEWKDVYSEWQAGYYYNQDNNYAYTQIPSTETSWAETQTYTAVSCTPYSNLIPVIAGEKYRYMNMPVHFDSKNAEIPSIIIFNSSKSRIASYTRTYQDEYTEFTIPENGVWMAVIYANSQTYVLQKQVVKSLDKNEVLDNIMADYRSYSLTSPPTPKPLTKAYICLGTDDLRPYETKNLHTLFTSNNIPYYMAAIPGNMKACITDDPYKTNLDYMELCVQNGGEIICHSGPVITEANKNDFDTMYQYFCKNKEELEHYGFDVRGIFKAGGDNAIYDDADPIIDAWATHYYEFGDYFTDDFPFTFNRVLLDDWASYSGLAATMQNIITNHGYFIGAFHYYNANAELAIDTILDALSGYTEGVDYEFVTPSQLYDLLMPTTRSSGGSGTSYSISMSGNVITLTGSSGSTSSVTLPVYNGEIWTGGSY